MLDDVVGTAAIDRGRHRRHVVHARHVADAHGVARHELEPEEILKRARDARPPEIRRHARSSPPSTKNPPAGRLIQPAQELHQRRLAGAILAHDRDHRAGLEMQVHVIEHEAVGAGIGERHVLEADALFQSLGHR